MDQEMVEFVKKSPPPFLLKTYMMVEDPSTDGVISWNGDGTGFVVWQPAEFARDLLPTLFKHSNFSSFIRQLNTYGFRKVATTRWEFSNENFRKGKKNLLCEIRRRRNKLDNKAPQFSLKPIPKDLIFDDDQRSSSTSSSFEYNILVDENKRLKQENRVLNSELLNMKRQCKELIDLVSNYARREEKVKGDQRPMLFGVRLDLEVEREKKRKRETSLVSQLCK